ncbi:MAG: putative thioredoxin [Paracoccaceae bacterium]|jgi:putative thioredoxin
MFGLTPPSPPANATKSQYIKEGTDADFMIDVIEASREAPVIVDFWAPWCGPCKTLGPMLETAVDAAGGKVRMVKIDIEQHQAIAAQLKVQSIPMVFAFFGGKPVDGFQGAQSGSEIKAFVDRLSVLASDGGLAEALVAAEAMLADGAVLDAAETFAAIFEEDPRSAAAYAGMLRAYIVLPDLDRVATLLDAVPADLTKAKEIEAARAQYELALQALSVGPEAELHAAVEADPNDMQARFDLALALYAAAKIDEAVDGFLEIFRRDCEWNDGAAKAQLAIIFEALPTQDPIALRGRRRLSSMIFV